ncbi:M23 family metallopeptidase [Deinococcus sp. QL22]|uniref:LysM peptidoglycan-binding domain-containing M23 family metallopeptidase n=1 Tax=Deinococcus sp. QL22 TaxID=2939437 RepID=UPI002017792D|nr:M23 family metallopeptidase [Deinococcus sp. QL22]UQN09483.1 LysM peptidoglycan-binding domain-containing M23 family metallopeptidase [Deinococcus sp. QL22]
MNVPVALLAVLLSWGSGTYTVKPGDTLYSIAQTQGTTVSELTGLNRLQSPALQVGQILQLSSAAPAVQQMAGVTVTAPTQVRMGDAFVLRLSGSRVQEATVRFPSEVGEDVRLPNEVLKPVSSAGGALVFGRVVLGKSTPVVYEIRVGQDVIRGSIPVTDQRQATQHLNLPSSISSRMQDPARKAEEEAVERAYTLRTAQQWNQPFQVALSTRLTASAFGQPRTYTAGSPVVYHYGEDYLAKAGTPVRAVNAGVVVVAGNYPVRGGLVIIDHGLGVTSLYFHQRRVLVRVGQTVSRGQQLGEVGSEGVSNAPHLHLELRVRGEATRPAQWMNRIWPQ